MTAHKNGFTIIELIVVIGVIVILAVIAIPIYTKAQNVAKYETDNASVSVLNYSTKVYAHNNNIQSADIFTGVGDDEARMQMLVDEKFLTEMVYPQQEDAEFEWIISDQNWIIDGGMEED